MPDYRQKALSLIELALDDEAPSGERASAALRAVEIIDKYDLISGGQSEVGETVSNIVDRVTDPEFINSMRDVGDRFFGRQGREGSEGRRRRRRRRRREE